MSNGMRWRWIPCENYSRYHLSIAFSPAVQRALGFIPESGKFQVILLPMDSCQLEFRGDRGLDPESFYSSVSMTLFSLSIGILEYEKQFLYYKSIIQLSLIYVSEKILNYFPPPASHFTKYFPELILRGKAEVFNSKMVFLVHNIYFFLQLKRCCVCNMFTLQM